MYSMYVCMYVRAAAGIPSASAFVRSKPSPPLRRSGDGRQKRFHVEIVGRQRMPFRVNSPPTPVRGGNVRPSDGRS